MDQYVNELKVEEGKEESKGAAAADDQLPKSRIAILHSRYASRKNTMRDK